MVLFSTQSHLFCFNFVGCCFCCIIFLFSLIINSRMILVCLCVIKNNETNTEHYRYSAKQLKTNSISEIE